MNNDADPNRQGVRHVRSRVVGVIELGNRMTAGRDSPRDGHLEDTFQRLAATRSAWHFSRQRGIAPSPPPQRVKADLSELCRDLFREYGRFIVRLEQAG